MKFLFFALVTSTLFGINAEELSGDWCGKIENIGGCLSLNLHITKDLEGSLECVEQKVSLPLNDVAFDGTHFSFKIDAVSASYKGMVEQDKIVGIFSQGTEMPLHLSRGVLIASPLSRPQEEKALKNTHPVENIQIINGEISLAGTFVTPSGKETFPTVLFIPGSGPLDRDETFCTHKPFLVIANHLADHGIASLRIDKRGVGESEGDFSKATYQDFIKDYLAAISYLKTEKKGTILGLITHSEGAMLAPEIATVSPDVNFMILLAGPGTTGLEVLLKQNALILQANGVEQKAIDQHVVLLKKICTLFQEGVSIENLKTTIKTEISTAHPDVQKQWKDLDPLLKMISAPWFQSFLTYDPQPYLSKVNVPTLAINGSIDLQVCPKQNLYRIEKALKEGNNPPLLTIELEGVNHALQHGITGSPNEYATIEETVAPEILELITRWIHQVSFPNVNKNDESSDS